MSDYTDIKKFGREVMERYGWMKLIDFNSNRRIPSTFVDQLWIHKERKYWAFIEEKYGEDSLSEAQERLWCTFLAYSPDGMFYALVSDEDDWLRIAEVA